MKQTKYTAFTLVELIVVIAILAVLATVAFISFQGYSQSSRDTKRTADIATISKGVQVYRAEKSSVPEPSETKTTISFSGSELVTQGYAGKSVLDTIRVKDAKDPVDDTFYTYATNANNTQFQLIALLEADLNANNYLGNPIFANYSDRIPYSAGQNVGVLLNQSNTPVQELGNATIELQNNSTQYKVSLGGKKLTTSTGGTLQTEILGAQKNLFGWRSMDPNCPIEDIVIGDQVWAGCNSTLGDGFDWGQNVSDIGTNNYNGNVSNCYDYNSVDNPTDTDCSISNDNMRYNANPIDFFQQQEPRGANNNGDTEVSTIWGKFYRWDSVESACPSGWRVPNFQDYQQLTSQLNNSEICATAQEGYYCNGMGWGGHSAQNSSNNLVNLLQIPLAGFSHTNNFNEFQQYRGSAGYLWFSYGAGKESYRLRLTNNESRLHFTINDFGVYSFSARCIRD